MKRRIMETFKALAISVAFGFMVFCTTLTVLSYIDYRTGVFSTWGHDPAVHTILKKEVNPYERTV